MDANFFVKLNLDNSNINVIYQIINQKQKRITFDEFATMCKYKKTVEDAKRIFKGLNHITNWWKEGESLYVLSFVSYYYGGRKYETIKALPIVGVGNKFNKYVK